jgi:hypothetical protein
MEHLRRKATYTNVISSLCLFPLLGGGAAFAAGLAKNSVGTRQLKKNAVTTAKIKNGAVTGAKLAVASLPTVPGATRPGTADHAASADHATSADRRLERPRRGGPGRECRARRGGHYCRHRDQRRYGALRRGRGQRRSDRRHAARADPVHHQRQQQRGGLQRGRPHPHGDLPGRLPHFRGDHLGEGGNLDCRRISRRSFRSRASAAGLPPTPSRPPRWPGRLAAPAGSGSGMAREITLSGRSGSGCRWGAARISAKLGRKRICSRSG